MYERERMLEQINALLKSLVKVENRGYAACDHVTVGPQYLPCPHPDCLILPDLLSTVHVRKLNPGFRWTLAPQADPSVEPYVEEQWRRSELVFLGWGNIKVLVRKLWVWEKVGK